MLTLAPSSIHGKGVFTDQHINKGSLVLRMMGRPCTGAELRDLYSSAEDYYVQTGPDLYLSPSGDIDDRVNHSCKPNCAMIIRNGAAQLKALRNINPDEEITWDYSTTAARDNWSMSCNCGEGECRRKVKSFETLPVQIKNYYLGLGAVPDYAQAISETLIYRSPLRLISSPVEKNFGVWAPKKDVDRDRRRRRLGEIARGEKNKETSRRLRLRPGQ